MENIDLSKFNIPEPPPLMLSRSEFASRLLSMGEEIAETISQIELSSKLDIASQIKDGHLDIYA